MTEVLKYVVGALYVAGSIGMIVLIVLMVREYRSWGREKP